MTARACGLIEWCQQAETLRWVTDAIVGADLIDGNGTLYDRPENSREVRKFVVRRVADECCNPCAGWRA
jgi:hypothetical protein